MKKASVKKANSLENINSHSEYGRRTDSPEKWIHSGGLDDEYRNHGLIELEEYERNICKCKTAEQN